MKQSQEQARDTLVLRIHREAKRLGYAVPKYKVTKRWSIIYCQYVLDTMKGATPSRGRIKTSQWGPEYMNS